jgi:predicted MFS family arabinose efflux permease
MTRRLITLMACACGFAVANLYYSQPLLEQIRGQFKTTAGAAGLISTLTQIGYTLGLLFLVPLGDTLRRRRLIVGLLGVEAVFLALTALSPSLLWMQVASLGVGIATVAAQVIVPLVAQLSPAEKRGQNVGTVMSGLLFGILGARVVAGIVGDHFGWRALYWLACGVALALAVVLEKVLPDVPPTTNISFRKLLRSLWALVKEEPTLRESALIGGLIFGSFMTFWTSLSFHLEGPPFHYSAQIVGLFGLVGAAGALVAPLAGRGADTIGSRPVISIASLVTVVSFGVYWIWGTNPWGIALGVILMDVGVQGTHIANQARVLALRPEARSRINTVYMVAYFIGGSLGSYCSPLAWTRGGWPAVCAVGLAFSSAAFLVHCLYGLVGRRA